MRASILKEGLDSKRGPPKGFFEPGFNKLNKGKIRGALETYGVMNLCTV